MKFNEKKEYYSLRKFKGIGLASALVGLAFLSPSVLAEENATPSVPVNEVGVVAPTSEPNKAETSNISATSESSKVENTSVAPEVANVGGISLAAGGSAKPEEVAKPAEVVNPEVSVSPVTPSSPRVEESSQDAKATSNKGTTDTSKPESTDSVQPTRSRRGKRSTPENSSPTINLPLSYGSASLPMTFPSVTETSKIDYTTSTNPSLESDNSDKKVYNNQIDSIEKVPTVNKDSHRFRITLKDGHTIPNGGKLVLATIGGGSPISKDLVIGSETVGTVTEYKPSLDGSKSFKDRLNSSTTVVEYVDTFEKMGANNLPVTSIVLEFNSNFSKYNVNRLVEFEIKSNTTNLVDYSLVRKNGLSGSSNAVVDSSGTSHTLEKRFTSYLLNPYDSKGIELDTTKSYISVNDAPKGTPISNELTVGMDWGSAMKPNYLDTVYTPSTGAFKVSNRGSSADSTIARKGSLLTYRLPDDSLFATSKYSVGDIVSVTYLDNVLNEASVSSNRFTDTDNYVNLEKSSTDSSKNLKGYAKFKLVERTEKGYKWELLEDISMKNSTFYMNTESLTPVEFRSDWVSRFGEANLKRFLEGTTRSASSYLGKEQLKAYATWTSNGVTKDISHNGLINKNTNLILGENTTGTLKVVHKSDTGEILKAESVVADNKPWYTPVTIDPQNFEGYQFKRSSELLSTIVGSGNRTIELTYTKPLERVSKEPISVTYVVDNTKDGTYRNEVVGTPKTTITSTDYIYSADTRTATSKETVTVQEGTPTVVTLGTKPTTEVTYQDFSTTYVADPERASGEKFTETAGVRGTTTVETTYSVNKETGEVTPTKGQPVVVAPRNAVVKVGTKPTVTETTIPVTTKYKADTSIDFGKEEVESQGQVGTRTTTTPKVLNTQDGTVSDGQPTTQETPMIPKVVKKGTKPTVTETPVNFTTVYEADETKGKGVRTDKVAGVQGKVITTTTYTLDESTGNVTANNPTERREEPTNKVVTVGTAPTVTTKRIAHGVEYQRDDTVSATSPSTRVQDGVDGEKRTTVTYSVNPTTGVVTDNAPVETKVAPKPQIEKLGTKPEDIVTTQDFKRTFVADETKDLGYRQVETQGVQGKTVIHRTYSLPENVPPVEDNGQSINYEFAVAIPHDSEPKVTAPINEVTRVGVKPKVDTQTVAITTKYVEDATLDFGQVVETEKGSEGRVVTTTTYTMNPADGTTTVNEPTVVTTPMVQRVVKVGIKPKVVDTPVNFTTRYEGDETSEAGKKTTTVKGVNGKVTTTTTYTMNPTTGVVTENTSTSVREEPTTEVVKVGTKPKVVTEKVEKATRYEADPTKANGKQETSVEGSDGSVTTTTLYVLNKENGSVTEGTPIVEKIPAVEKVIKVGTKPKVDVTPVPFTTSYEASPTLGNGTTTDKVVGKEGKVTTTTTYNVNPKTGEVTENPSTSVREEPVTRVVSVGSKSTTVVTEQDFTTSYVGDFTKEVGFRETRVNGVKGTISVTTTYSVNPTSGKVTPKEGSPVVVEPKEEVVALGTKPKVDVESLPKTTRYEKDSGSDKGVSTTSVEGSNGSKTTTTTYTVNPKTGKVTPNTPTVVTVPAVEKVVKVGGKTEVVRSKDSEGRDVIDTTTYEVDSKTGKVTPTTVRTYGKVKEPTVEKVVVSSPVRYEADNEREVGSENIVLKGKDGEDTITTTYLVDEATGKITSVVGKPVRTLEPTPTVVKVGAKPKVTETPIEPDVEYIKDGTRSVGEPNIVEQGVKGVSSVTNNYSVNPKTGEISENVGTPVVNPSGKTLIKVAAKDKVEEVKLGGALVRRTTTYEVNSKTGEVTSLVSVKEDALSQIPNDAPKVEIPEFTGGVVPNNAPVLELPELKVPEEHVKPQPVGVSDNGEETPQTTSQEPAQENQLPNTGGGDSVITAAMGIVSLLAGLGITARKSKED